MANRCRHEFTALHHPLGEYGRQDVHIHPCFTEDCDRAIIGEGRDHCDPSAKHWRATLTEHGPRREGPPVERAPRGG